MNDNYDYLVYALYNYSYFLLVVPMLIFSLIASAKVKSAFRKYSSVFSVRGLTGAQAAQQVLNHYGINNVVIERVAGNLTDHYDPKTNSIRLSDGVYDSTSVAAIGVACHEAGHAAQYATGYSAVKVRSFIYPACSIGSKAGIPLAIIGIIMGFGLLVDIGIILFTLAVFFQIVTLPVEFNASKRAIKVIEATDILGPDEIKGARKVLSAAAMTYVASLAVSVANLLRLLLLRGRRR